jgi:parallel beta-helix repeat protein
MLFVFTLCVFLFFSSIIFNNIYKNIGNSERISLSDDNSTLDSNFLKSSTSHELIYINDNDPNFNWLKAKTMGICTGQGYFSDPYIIENLVLDGGGNGVCIRISNSSVFFKIRNCTIINFGMGISLGYTINGLIENNTLLLNLYTISLGECENNTISNNLIKNNLFSGIRLLNCYNNNISGNTINSNDFQAIELIYSRNNKLVGNQVNNNNQGGIGLLYSDNNIISGNSVINNTSSGIGLYESHNVSISGNIANYNSGSGIILMYSNYSLILGNTANNNRVGGMGLGHIINTTISGNIVNYNPVGIRLWSSHYNTISGNTLIENNKCMVVTDSTENTIKDNGFCIINSETLQIPGYNLFILIGLLSFLTILIKKKMKKS